MIERAMPILMIALLFLGIVACEEENMEPALEVPETYSFDNVSYDGQIQRLQMLTEMKSYMSTSRQMGVELSAARLRAMYANEAAGANWEKTYSDSKELMNKTFESEQATFFNLFDELAEASESDQPGSKGVAGVVESNDGNKSYLLGADGLDHAQLIEKGLMGACFYYQATAVYLGEQRMNVDNETVVPGEGTEMEHHWDEAFGYFGVPRDFPQNKDGLAFWGSYSDKRNEVLGSNEKLMDALILGRAAISANDLDTRDEAIVQVREQWELISVGSALHYLNETIANFDDMAIRAHALSEGLAFVYSLQFNPAKRINNQQVAELLTLMGGGTSFSDMNLYEVEVADLEEARKKLANYYDLEDEMDLF